jgi:hypothetical protein
MAKLWKHPGACVALIAGVLAFSQVAQAVSFAGGTGEPNDPYLVASRDHLLTIGSNASLASKCFKLVADIDLAGLDSSTAIVPTFSGTFDGNGHAIRNMRLTCLSTVGFFGIVLSTGRVLNLNLSDVDVVCLQYAGALAGQNDGTVRRCNSTGSVVSLSSSSCGGGGLVGYNTGIVTDSQSAADAGSYYRAGGLVGSNSGTVTNCGTNGSAFGYNHVGSLIGYNSGIVTASCSSGDATGNTYAGGLIGYNAGSVTNCYSSGPVTGYSYTGGLVGYNTGRISGCYCLAALTPTTTSSSSLGYLVGYNSNSVTACYYVPTQIISGVSISTAGTSLTAPQMKQRTNLVGWDFWGTANDGTADIWFMPPNAYPALAWQTEITGLVAVPDISGLPLDEAKAALAAVGLTGGAVTQDYHRTVPVGSIIWAHPHAWTLLGGTVDLVVSKGATYDWAQNPGNGSAANPFQIQSAGQLELLGDHAELWSKSFVLMADLDMSGRTYATAVIAPDTSSAAGFQGTTFTGSFNGNTHAIVNLLISGDSSAAGTYFGLFGMIDNTSLVNSLTLKNATVITGTATSATYAGTLAGLSGGTIVACYSTGTILTDSNANAGSLVGYNHGSIVNCQTDVVITRTAAR